MEKLMNFRDFVKKDNSKRVQPEPEELEEEYYEEEPIDELDENTEEYEEEWEEEPEPEPVRPAPRVVRQQPRVAPRPAPVRQPQPVYRPQPQRVQRQAMPIDQYNRPIQISKKQLAENTIENTANTLTEAIKRKVDTIFYRFGIQGLEKLDEKILDTIEELQYPEPRQIKKSGVNMRRVPAKRVVRKPKPLPIEDIKPSWKNVPEFKGAMEEPNVEEAYEEPILPPEQYYYEEPAQEPVEEIVEQVEEPVEEVIEEKKEPSLMELASQLLDIDPAKELKHEPGGANPVFSTTTPPPIDFPGLTATNESEDIPIALEVPPVETPKIIEMPKLEEVKEEKPVEAPVKKTRKKKVEKDTTTNEEK